MIRILQINVGVCRAAQDLALATANEKAVDIILVSEQYRDKGEEEGWYPDAGGRAAIAVLGRHQIDVIGPCLPGFRWIETNGLRLFSCYCSPNVPSTEFETFLRRLEISIREAKGPVIVGGDFNAKSQDWGSCKEDNRGKALADLIASLGLISCNQGNEPTFVRGASESHIDITFASRAVADRVRDWKVLDEESLSLHRYIQYSIAAQRTTYQNPPHTGWAIRKLDRSKLKEALQRVAHVGDQNAEEACNTTIRWLTRACDASMPKSGKNNRRPVPWWSPDIADQRRKCLKARRAFTRKRKKTDDAGCAAELESFKHERKTLSIMIQDAKDENWKRLCELVEKDPWGQPYKIAMKKLNVRKPIPGLDLPGRMDTIVDTLFPTRATITNKITPISQEELDEARFTPGDVAAAAKALPNGKAPGPDGIPNEVLKVAVGLHPEHFAELFNHCIRGATYPEIWKVAKLVLLRKPGKPLDNPSAYRPLCMLDSTGKLFEKLLTARLREHLQTSGNTTDNQYGFKRGRSTLHAMSRVRSVFQDANGRGQARNLFVGMLLLDVKNAFNSASWPCIMSALERKETPKYLRNIIGQYLSNRTILVSGGGRDRPIKVSCGVPQGSVIGPDLWNVLYDDLLRLNLPTNVEIIAFADDIALVATASTPFLLEELLEVALGAVMDWMRDNGLELAIEKTEAIVLTNRNKHNSMTVRCGLLSFPSVRCVKYLGVLLDARLHFNEHGEHAAARAGEACRQLTRILPNLRGAKQKTRRVLATVVTSRLLYGAPFWFPSITTKAFSKMESIYRRAMLRVACCYSTVSHEAASVITGMPPLKLLAEERVSIFRGVDRNTARANLLSSWQTAWNSSSKGRWTHRLIGDLGPWLDRKHGEVTYHLCQLLSGHGCFNNNLFRFGNANTESCSLCGKSPDTAEHAVFECDAFHHCRNTACVYLGVGRLSAENIVEIMLRSNEDWRRVSSLVGRIMVTREADERARQQMARQQQQDVDGGG